MTFEEIGDFLRGVDEGSVIGIVISTSHGGEGAIISFRAAVMDIFWGGRFEGVQKVLFYPSRFVRRLQQREDHRYQDCPYFWELETSEGETSYFVVEVMSEDDIKKALSGKTGDDMPPGFEQDGGKDAER